MLQEAHTQEPPAAEGGPYTGRRETREIRIDLQRGFRETRIDGREELEKPKKRLQGSKTLPALQGGRSLVPGSLISDN